MDSNALLFAATLSRRIVLSAFMLLAFFLDNPKGSIFAWNQLYAVTFSQDCKDYCYLFVRHSYHFIGHKYHLDSAGEI